MTTNLPETKEAGTSEFSDDYFDAIFRSIDDALGIESVGTDAPTDLDSLSAEDMSWLGPLEPVRRDPLLVALHGLMEEFQSGRPNVFLRSVMLEGTRYLAVGTWLGQREGSIVRINAAPGSFKSLVSALDGLVVKDLREEGPDGEHRVWLLPHRAGMPLKCWLSKDGRNVGVLYYVLSEEAWKKVDAAEYTRVRGAGS